MAAVLPCAVRLPQLCKGDHGQRWTVPHVPPEDQPDHHCQILD